MNFEQEFGAYFGDRFQYLYLKDVMIKKREGICIITFLYPSNLPDIKDEEKQEIVEWFKSVLGLEKIELRVKFMKAYIEERLILKTIANFFEKKYKLITSYLKNESFKIKITPIDVLIDIEVSPRQTQFFAEHKISAELAKVLKENYLIEFVVNVKENVYIDDEVDIENVEMKTAYRLPQRYKVEIIKDVIGKDIVPKPEFMSFITSPKTNVIVAGYIKKIERKDFVMKKGKRAGEQKAFFTFVLADGKGKLECLYFCPKRNEAVMEALEECMYVVVHGDVRLNQLNKLCLYVDKIALATEIGIEEEEQQEEKGFEGRAVEVEKLTALEQDTMFGRETKYNNKIMGKSIVVFDVETTGLDPSIEQIIELGAVKIEDGNIVEKFSTFVKPTKKIPFEVVRLTGITDEMVEDAPPIEFVIKEFYEFSKGCILSGHNITDFDIKFVRNAGENYGLNFDNEIIDTLKEARTKLKITRFNLGTVVKTLGLTLEGAHRAWNDAFATAQVLLKLNEIGR